MTVKYAIVADDEFANREFMVRLMQMAGFEVHGAWLGAQALAFAEAAQTLTLALVDHQLPDARGVEIIPKLRAMHPEALLVMATMHDHRELIDEAFSIGVDIFLVKPHGFMELFRRLQEAEGNYESLRRIIMDQYGPRPYRGAATKRVIS
ncbi:MAG: response regulator [Chloroflexi bacterium]|nr:response regulator [Chloroflexota bacterium]